MTRRVRRGRNSDGPNDIKALVDSLLRSVRGEPAQNAVLPTRLVVRRSCGG
jgi:hypothetical protein